MSATALILGVIVGLALAATYVLIAISFTLVLAVSGVFNFAQGTIVMLGTLLAFVLGVHLGWPVLAALAVTFGVGALGGLFTYAIAVWPALGRSDSFTHTTLLTTVGLGMAANAFAASIFGADTSRVPAYVSESPFMAFGIPVRPVYALMVGVGLAVTAGTEWVVRRTAIGHIFRSTLEDPEGSQLIGIDTRRTIVLTFAVAGVLSAIAGFLIAPVTGASAFSAHELAFYGFAGMAIGGFGSFVGSLTGGLIVGVIAGITPVLLDPHLTMPILWLAVVAVLLIKPAGLWGIVGLFGAARERDV